MNAFRVASAAPLSGYLYNNRHADAAARIRGLEAIEDEITVSRLANLMSYDGRHCLEVGAGAGSIALWLANQVGQSGSVVATDVEPHHLCGDAYEVWQHDLEKDPLPADTFDLVHIRHVLIHLNSPSGAIQALFNSLKPDGFILAEESDLRSWIAIDGPPETKRDFNLGVEAVLQTYESRGMNIGLGSTLSDGLSNVGFKAIHESRQSRTVAGASIEAGYQSLSAKQLAETVDHDRNTTHRIKRLAHGLLNPRLRYRSRTTVSVSAQKPS